MYKKKAEIIYEKLSEATTRLYKCHEKENNLWIPLELIINNEEHYIALEDCKEHCFKFLITQIHSTNFRMSFTYFIKDKKCNIYCNGLSYRSAEECPNIDEIVNLIIIAINKQVRRIEQYGLNFYDAIPKLRLLKNLERKLLKQTIIIKKEKVNKI